MSELGQVRRQGRLHGLEVELEDGENGNLAPQFALRLDDVLVPFAELLGQGVRLTFVPPLACIACDKVVRKLYAGGHCYDCFTTLARCDLCVVSPERCHYDAGTCREPSWGESFCMQPHAVYLANSSGPKIGLTRSGRERRRWIDQGATEALVIARAPSRRAAGVVEAHFKRHLNDRTDWRKLVSGGVKRTDLPELAGMLREQLPEFASLSAANVPSAELGACVWEDAVTPLRISYPVLSYSPPQRLSVNAEHLEICDNVQGVVGQYLLMSTGAFNLADHRGAAIDVTVGAPFAPEAISNNEQMSLF